MTHHQLQAYTQKVCPRCLGGGYYDGEPCITCNGSGKFAPKVTRFKRFAVWWNDNVGLFRFNVDVEETGFIKQQTKAEPSDDDGQCQHASGEFYKSLLADKNKDSK